MERSVPDAAVVAVVLTWQGRLGLFRRSAHVGSDAGRWHCITGFLESGTAYENAARELREETGLDGPDQVRLRDGPTLHLSGAGGEVWRVHVFTAEAVTGHLRLNWEHDDYRWVQPGELCGIDGQVAWLGAVLDAATGTSAGPEDAPHLATSGRVL